MRSRTLREGSVGLLILLGLGLFGFSILWLRGVSLGSKSYKILVEFANVAKMQVGAAARYRGVTVGKINAMRPGTNGVEVEIVITSANLLIPRDVLIEANQGGLLGDTSVDITPLKQLPPEATDSNPLAANCNSAVIICDRDRLQGVIGVNLDELIRGSIKFTNLFADPAFFNNLNALVKNSTVAAAQITELTREVTDLTQSVQKELGVLSNSAIQSTNALSKAAEQVGSTASQFGSTANQINATVREFGATAGQVSAAANQINVTARQYGDASGQLGSITEQINLTSRQFGAAAGRFADTAGQLNATAAQVNRLVGSVNELVTTNGSSVGTTLTNLSETSVQLRTFLTTNQATITSTLNNLSQSSEQVRAAVNTLTPVLNNVEQGNLLSNLQSLSENAAQASANLRDFSNPTNLLLLQQTLDSARATFQNAEKITSDLDDLTGDPNFRTNIRNLIRSLNDLLSSSHQLQEQTQIAQSLASLSAALNSPALQKLANDNKSATLELVEPDATLTPPVPPSDRPSAAAKTVEVETLQQLSSPGGN